MSLEKGVSRIGTVSGIVLGVVLSISCTFIGLSLGYFNYFSDKYEKEDLTCCSNNELEINIDNVRKFMEDDSGTNPFKKHAQLNKVERDIFDFLETEEGQKMAEQRLKKIKEENESCLERYRTKHQAFLGRIYKNKPNKLTAVYLPTLGVYFLLIIAPFLFGLYSFKGVTGILNWIIKGFRE